MENDSTNKTLSRPSWIRVPSSTSKGFAETLNVIRNTGVHTVCEEALCPNIGECWKSRTATFLIMGDTCTRSCAFCNVRSGTPQKLDKDEPSKIAQSVKSLGIKYVVLTCVTRDDLEDGGALHFSRVISEIRRVNSDTKIEILTSDMRGNYTSVEMLTRAKPDVFGHNMEVVRSLHPKVKRSPADYDISLNFLKRIKEIDHHMVTKTGIMVGVGETKEAVLELIDDMVGINVNIISIGQYLTPTKRHFPISRYVTPEEFDEYRQYGERLGIQVVSGPLVRSSYKAFETYNNTLCHLNHNIT